MKVEVNTSEGFAMPPNTSGELKVIYKEASLFFFYISICSPLRANEAGIWNLFNISLLELFN